MRIGVDACCWSNRRGFGRFARELLTALTAMDQKNEYWLFVDQKTAGQHRFPANAYLEIVQTDQAPVEAASASGRRSLADLWAMSRHVATKPLEIFFFPAIYSYFPVLNHTKVVVTIHDMTPAKFAKAVFPNRKLQFFWNLKQWLALRQADRIVTVSEYSRKQIMEHLRLPESKVQVVTEGPGDAFRLLPCDEERVRILAKFNLNPQDRFLLYAGGISPHKNLRFLIEVYSELLRLPAFADLYLVLAGDHERDSFYSDYSELRAAVERLDLGNRVVFTGYLEDSELAHLYNAAELFVFPSLQEGFGLPAVEAMACGSPIAAGSAGSLPEVIGDAGVFFDPTNRKEAIGVIRGILLDSEKRQELRKRGLKRVGQFQWTLAAQQALKIFEDVAQASV